MRRDKTNVGMYVPHERRLIPVSQKESTGVAGNQTSKRLIWRDMARNVVNFDIMLEMQIPEISRNILVDLPPRVCNQTETNTSEQGPVMTTGTLVSQFGKG